MFSRRIDDGNCSSDTRLALPLHPGLFSNVCNSLVSIGIVVNGYRCLGIAEPCSLFETLRCVGVSVVMGVGVVVGVSVVMGVGVGVGMGMGTGMNVGMGMGMGIGVGMCGSVLSPVPERLV